MIENETGCPPNNQDFPRNDEEGAIHQLYNLYTNRYASRRYALLSPTKEGNLTITVEFVVYSLNREALRDLLCFGNTVNFSQHGVTPDTNCAIHPAGHGVVITLPGDTYLVPRCRFEKVARAEITGLIVFPSEES